jgi:uncharacterized lipoprotein YmbA
LAVTLLSLLLAACASSGPPPRLLRLPATLPLIQTQALTQPTGATPSAAGATDAWQLIGPIGLPNYLDNDAVLVADGPAGLRPLPGVRWAEALRDAVPRVLTADLARLRGAGPLWTGPVPARQTVQRELRLTITALDAQADGSVSLRARWTLLDPTGTQAPISRDASVHTAAGPRPAGGSATPPAAAPLSADALVVTERLALWQLAQLVAGSAAPGL